MGVEPDFGSHRSGLASHRSLAAGAVVAVVEGQVVPWWSFLASWVVAAEGVVGEVVELQTLDDLQRQNHLLLQLLVVVAVLLAVDLVAG